MRLCALIALVGCSGGTSGVTPLFTASGDDFYALPFPNDMRRHPDGTLDLSAFPGNSPLVLTYRDVIAQELDGFGMNEAVYARFDGALDPMSLPDPASSMMPGASVYIINITTSSPEYKHRTPIIASFRGDPRGTMGPNSLVARPYPGFGLLEGTTYALVVTKRVLDTNGKPVLASDEFQTELATCDWYIPFRTYLDSSSDDTRDDVVTGAVFTTQHITDVMAGIRAGVFGSPAPVASNIVVGQNNAMFKEFTGAYTAPNFQSGPVPYTNPPDGQITIQNGAAVVSRMETMRFALTVPPGATPANGWPIAIYAHGTGGDYQSFIDDGTGARLAAQGIATISTDQVLHGPRNPGGNPETDFFNFGNPYAARDNALQGAADAFSQLRLAVGMSFADGTRTIKFDPTKVYFFGHSQGGLTGPGFVAFEPTLSGAVFSGTAGLLYLALLYKTQPVNIPAAVDTLIRDEPVDEDNPTLHMLQMWVERTDGANYAPLMVRRPTKLPDGTQIVARNIFQTEGFTDTYAPNPGIEAFATALGGDLVMLPDEQAVLGLTMRGRAVKSTPFDDNLDGVTAVLAQYKQATGSDGHFVVFDITSAKEQSAEFLGTLAATGTASVVTPH
jgi:hypothetical protein